jgi:vacuolar-type H+-ATPase subunit B/Vma2
MVKRLVEQYQMNDVVEVKMKNGVWITAVVIKLQHPGIWVQTITGFQWFVTNSSRVRLKG